jgi:outer membrane protein OmpA-like peptidoglycan-associated protein
MSRLLDPRVTEQEETHWLSVSDLMAGLMMVFLFIAIALMRNAFMERDKIREVAVAYQENQVAIYDALMEEFAEDLPRWDAVIDADSLTFTFQSPDVLFALGKIDLSREYQELLAEFFPRYMQVLGQFTHSINEVRIEGHTSSVWNSHSTDTEAYFLNMELSQGRTRSVLAFVYDMADVAEYQDWIKRHFAAVGLSSSRPVLDEQDQEKGDHQCRNSDEKNSGAAGMKLTVSFAELWASAKRMGDHEVTFEFNAVNEEEFTTDRILSSTAGLDIALEDLELDHGVLSFKGRQVLLFIPDQGSSIEQVLSGQQEGRKFHVADCSTLEEMRRMKRFSRYKATNNLGGKFEVYGTSHYSGSIKGEAELKVCKNCLSYLNYKGYRSGSVKLKVYTEFDIAEFLSEYSTLFSSMPDRADFVEQGGYSEDWSEVSARYRQSTNFCCESCQVDLSDYRRLLHTHHVNGNKRDNRAANLKALCIDCHRKQPLHEYMRVTHADMVLLTQLRKQQGLMDTGNWQEVREMADQALDGLIRYYERKGTSLPDVGFELTGADGAIVAELELAWPRMKKGVAIQQRDIETAARLGWRVLTVGQALKEMNH